MEEFEKLMPVSASIEKQQEQRQKMFLVLTLVGLLNDLDSVCDQILASQTVPTVDELFSRLLRFVAAPSHTMISSKTLDSSVFASQTVKNQTVHTVDELFSRLLRFAAAPSHPMISSKTLDSSVFASQIVKNRASQTMENIQGGGDMNDSHWDAVVRILRYIKSALGKGLFFEDRGHEQIVGYSNVNWVGSPSDRRSTSGYCVLIGGNLVSWKRKKQNVVARSSAEAEYQAMAMVTCELIWIKQLLKELKFGDISHIELVCDNQAALHIASNPVFQRGPED
ncbi:uncharacterized protein [Nicotiana sylvestris]|uniref:uncharacterized protein n=1 Tax=Nicotiana sylvestris TaxID=4096 RepID=UPI00388CC61C